jgi:anti-sigma B factor antagonist
VSSIGTDRPVDFALVVERTGAATVVRVSGELDLHTAGQLEEAISTADGLPLVVDLSEVTFLDSTALGVLIRTSRRAPDRPVPLVLDGLELRRIFEITGLERHFEFVASVEEALA